VTSYGLGFALAAVAAPVIYDVGFGYGYEALPTYDKRGGSPGVLAFLAGWAVGVATVAAWIPARCSAIAARAVKVAFGTLGGF
jgi:hypothetical protein